MFLKIKGIHNNLNIVEINLFIKAKIIIIQKKFSQLFSGSVNLLISNLVYKVLNSNLVFEDSNSENNELNNLNIDGIEIKFLKSVFI